MSLIKNILKSVAILFGIAILVALFGIAIMMVFNVTTEDFDKEVLSFDGKVLVDFWAEWCGPCMMLGPVIEEVSEEIDDVKFCKVNCDEARELALEYGIMSIPCLLVFENGELVNQSIGYIDKDSVINLVK